MIFKHRRYSIRYMRLGPQKAQTNDKCYQSSSGEILTCLKKKRTFCSSKIDEIRAFSINLSKFHWKMIEFFLNLWNSFSQQKFVLTIEKLFFNIHFLVEFCNMGIKCHIPILWNPVCPPPPRKDIYTNTPFGCFLHLPLLQTFR